MSRNRKKRDNSTNYNELRVAKKWKKGFFSIWFSRLGLVLIMLLLQGAVLVTLWLLFGDVIGTIYMDEQLFLEVVVLLLLYNSPMDSSAKLSWMLLISIIPVAGTIFYFWTQIEVGHRRLKRDLTLIDFETKNVLVQDQKAIEGLQKISADSAALSKYLYNVGHFPVYENNTVEYFTLGEKKLPRMLEELEKAEKFIFLEYFIVEEGHMWGKIVDILAKKAKAGVDVRVMYDGTCVFSTLPYSYPKMLAEYGIKCKMWEPIKPVLTSSYNYRDHRKILVIDGKVGFCGGVNLADEYINAIVRFGHWKDTAIMIKGSAVDSLTLMFLQMWTVSEKTKDTAAFSGYLGLYDKNITAKGYMIPYGDSPMNDHKIGERVYMDIINKAKDYVYITTPYLILDDTLRVALRYAAERGVDVRLMLPGIPDKKAIWALSKSHYLSLMQAGVKVYEYDPGFLHAKVFLSDDIKAVVGTINLDYRSLYHHFECAVYMHDTECIPDIKADMVDLIGKCRLVAPPDIYNHKLSLNLKGHVLKLVAPLL